MFVWMGVVFVMSSDFGSADHTSRILTPLLRWLMPRLSPDGIEQVHLVARKLAHVAEYAVLALLVFRALRILRDYPVARWSWSLALMALGIAAIYAATDEAHQMFVASRGPSIIDVAIDASGAVLGLTLAFLRSRGGRSAANEAAA